MNAIFFYLTIMMGHSRVKATVKELSPATLCTLGIGYRIPITVGKAFPWWLARQSTSR
jgi:hypothetical protein